LINVEYPGRSDLRKVRIIVLIFLTKSPAFRLDFFSEPDPVSAGSLLSSVQKSTIRLCKK
jgi:hypothetical protein